MLIDLRKLTVLFCGLMIILATSCKENGEGNPVVEPSLTINSQISPMRAYDSSWEANDMIGVYAVHSGASLSDGVVYENVTNYKFVTDGTGLFQSSGNSIKLKPGKNINVIAYYPYYNNVGDDFRIPLDVSDQSNPSSLDLLYGQSTTSASLANPRVSLLFDHKLSQLRLTLVAQDGSDLDGVQSILDGTIVKGSFDISTGEVILGSQKGALSGHLNSENGGTVSLSYMLLPGQWLKNAVVTFIVNGKRYSHKITETEAIMLEGGYRYTLPFAISSAGTLQLLVDGAVIDPMEDGDTSDVVGEEDGVSTTEDLEFPADNTSGELVKTIAIDAKSNETWTAVSDHSFVKLSQSTTQGPGDLTITLEENPTYEERRAKVVITIVPKNNTVSTRAQGEKRVRVINIVQAAKKKPQGEANLILLEAPFTNDLEGFTGVSVLGDYKWIHSSNKNGQTYAKMSGYNAVEKRAYANEDWLISPQFDMTGATIAKLTFKHAINFASNMQDEATLYFSLDYKDNVQTAKWIKVDIKNYPSTNGWDFVESGEILFPEEVLGQSNVRFAFKYLSTDSNASTWEINNLVVKADAGKVVGGADPTPGPDPEPDPGQPNDERAHYMEIPVVYEGKMTDGLYHMHMVPDSYFAGGSTVGGKRRNYTLYISKNSRMPYWVAYPMYPDCMGNVKRTNAWGWDPEIPKEYQPDLRRSYSMSQSRGHMLASSARTATSNLNKTTFYFSNMIPQYQTHNGGNWKAFEDLEKSWGSKNDNDTIYVVTGPIFDPNTSNTCVDKSGNQIPIPDYSWKVMLRYDRKDQKYYSIAVKMPNNRINSKWYDHITTVAALEKELGVTFFTHLPKDVANEVKNQKDRSKW